MRFGVLALALLSFWPAPAAAEWQVKPFLGVTYGGGTTLFDLDETAGSRNGVFGVSAVLLGEVLGVEGDFGYGPGFFTGDRGLVLGSGVTTLTGNVVVAMPRRLAQYSLRPYFVGGAGLMHASTEFASEALPPVASTLPAVDLGGGVTGFLSRRVGLNWDVRYFRSAGAREFRGQSFGDERLSFWRTTMALAIRY